MTSLTSSIAPVLANELPISDSLSALSNDEHYIVGGEGAKSKDFPWMVSLVSDFDIDEKFNPTGHFCGGSLIHPEWVLTAAHCFINSQKIFFGYFEGRCPVDEERISTKMYAIIGHTRLTEADRDDIQIIDVIIPTNDPSYDCHSKENDLALVRLSKPVQLGENIDIIELAGPEDSSLFAPEKDAVVAGWGLTTPFSEKDPKIDISDTLNKLPLPIVSNQVCNSFKSWKGFVNETSMLCAGYPQGEINTCEGDSGGPLMVQNPQGDYLQVGIVSFGHRPCNEEHKYSVYTKVSEFRDWIEENVPIGEASLRITTNLPPQTSVEVAVRKVDEISNHLNRDFVVDNQGDLIIPPSNAPIQLPHIPSGDYNIYLKPDNHLGEVLDETLVSGENVYNPEFKNGDFTNDNWINVSDFLELLANWGSDASSKYDLNNDGNGVNVSDILVFLPNWGEGESLDDNEIFGQANLHPYTLNSINLPDLANGDFELGPNGDWIESSTTYSNLIYNFGTTPRSGDWIAWLGDANNEISNLSQTVAIPSGGPVYLHYWYKIESEDTECSFFEDQAQIIINGSLTKRYDLCQSNNSTNWELDTIDMSGYAGQPITMYFHVETNEALSSDFFIDDVFFSNTPEAPGRIILTPDRGVFNVGDTFDVDVILDTGSHLTRGTEVRILYDPAVLEIQNNGPNEVTPNDLFKKYHRHYAIQSRGEIIIIADKVEDANEVDGIGEPFRGRGILGTIKFKAISSIENTVLQIVESPIGGSSITEDATEVNVLGQIQNASFQIIGSPNRLMPTISFIPTTNSLLNSDITKLDANAVDIDPHEHDQVHQVTFEINLNGNWISIGDDTNGDNGWSTFWDSSGVSDGTYDLRATASLLSGQGTTVTNNNVILDRTAPIHVSTIATPKNISDPGLPITIEITADDQGSGVDYIDVYAKSISAESEFIPWSYLGAISGSQGSLVWDTSNYEGGTYQIAVDIYDKAGNWGPESQPQILVGIGEESVYLPLVIKN